MKIKEYQDKAMETCMPSCENISYMLLNLVGEVSMNCRMSVSCGLSEWIEVRRCITDLDTLKWWEVEIPVLHSAGYYFMS